MLLRNLALIWIVFGFCHLTLYITKVQEKGSKKFLFKNQVLDNIFWTASNGRVPLATWSANPIWFVAWFFIIPFWRETHVYFLHRLLHWKPLLRAVHSNHHKNPNPGPWSGMSMHPLEHVGCFSCLLVHFVVPSHPIHFFYDAQLTTLTPAQGHSGFDKWPVGDYFYYLHHRYVSCNFCGATIPWYKWLGRFYNGVGPYQTKKY